MNLYRVEVHRTNRLIYEVSGESADEAVDYVADHIDDIEPVDIIEGENEVAHVNLIRSAIVASEKERP